MPTKLPWPEDPIQFRELLVAKLTAAFELGCIPHVRYVVVAKDAQLHAAFGRIDIARPGDSPEIHSKPKGIVRLVEWEPSPEKFLNRFQKALDGNPFEVGGQQIVGHAFDKNMEAWRHELDRQDYGCGWPIVMVSTDHFQHRPTYFDLIEADGPALVFNGLDDAVLQVSGFTFVPAQGRDLRPCRSQLLLWDYRGRIARREVSAKHLKIDVEPPSREGLKLLGNVVTTNGTFGILEPKPGSIERQADAPIRAVRLQLIEGDDMLDEISEVSLPTALDVGPARDARDGPWPWGHRETWNFIEPLDVGGQGITEKVQRSSTAEIGVMKTLKEKKWSSPDKRDKALTRFRREIEVAAGLSHPFILQVLDADADAEEPWLVTEYMPFGSLHDHLSVYRGDVWRTLRVARDVAVALGELHSKGLVHRDVKPRNIFLRDLDHPVLGDFGIVHDPDATDLTSVDEKVGASWFRPPEAELGRIDEPPPNFDVYSLGKVLWTLLSGGHQRFMQQEFRAKGFDLVEVLGRPALEPVNQLLGKMIVAEPAKRFESMVDVVRAIDAVLSEMFGGGNVCNRCGGRKFEQTAGLAIQGGHFIIGSQLLTMSTDRCVDCGLLRLSDSRISKSWVTWTKGQTR